MKSEEQKPSQQSRLQLLLQNGYLAAQKNSAHLLDCRRQRSQERENILRWFTGHHSVRPVGASADEHQHYEHTDRVLKLWNKEMVAMAAKSCTPEGIDFKMLETTYCTDVELSTDSCTQLSFTTVYKHIILRVCISAAAAPAGKVESGRRAMPTSAASDGGIFNVSSNIYLAALAETLQQFYLEGCNASTMITQGIWTVIENDNILVT